MKNDDEIKRLADKALNSMNNAEEVSPQPYLLTRINARFAKRQAGKWEKLSVVIGKPAILLPALSFILLVNAAAVVYHSRQHLATQEQVSLASDEFANNMTTIYENENP